jgi:hydroxymethylbilane synthase
LSQRVIKLGTRGSQLALAQTRSVLDSLQRHHPNFSFEAIDIKTIGDRKQGTPLASHGDKKDWIYELELGILAGKFDLVVHSAKDIPSNIEPGTEILPVFDRENPFDVFIGKEVEGKRLSFSSLEPGSKVGTSSLRRRACLKRLRPELEIVEHRGNINTRIEKLDSSSELSGIVLAAAGLNRLVLSELTTETFNADELMPAVNQGMLATQFASNREDIRELIKPLINQNVYSCWKAERTVVDIIEGDCKSSVGIFASIDNGQLQLSVKLMLPDGSSCIDVKESGEISRPEELGRKVAKILLSKGGDKILEESRLF